MQLNEAQIIQRNWEKYPPDKIEKLMDEGMTNQEAMAQCKKEWNSGLR